MGKIDISLKLGNVDVVDSDTLTDHIALDGLDIDGLRLQGFDNYMIEERRAKVSVQLAGYNEGFNKQLIDTITNPENRIYDYFEKNNAFDVVNTYVFSDKIALDATKDENLFKRELSMPETMMQNRSDNVLTVQSKVMMDMFLTMMDAPIAWDGSMDGVFDGMGISTIDDPASSKIKLKYKYAGISFNNMLIQTLSFLYRGIVLEYPDHNPKTQLKQYLNSIRDGFGDGIESLMSSNNPSRNLGWIFFIRVIIRLGGHKFNPLRDQVIPSIFQYLSSNEWIIDTPESNPVNVSDMVNSESNRKFVFAAFLASIVKYDWYASIKDDFFANNMDASRCVNHNFPMGAIPYIPFYRAIEVVRRKNSNRPNDNPYNIFFPWDGEILGNRHQVSALPYRVRHQDVCGRAQRLTVGDDDVSLNEITDTEVQELFDNEGLFIPVERRYEIVSSSFASIPASEPPVEAIVDTLNYGNIVGNIGDNFMCLTHYETTNWMYRKGIKAKETYAPNGGFTDMIPILRDGSGGIIHSHKDAFNKIYQIKYSDLMDIRLEIKVNNKLIYTGWVDYTTIEISNGRLSFTTTDAIGVLIENLEKLDGIIYFSQFDKGGNLIADKRAGYSIIDFMNRMARDPIPYKPLQWKGANSLLNAPKHSILNNKVLDDINPKDAFLIVLQASQRVLYAKGDGSLALDNISKYPDNEIPEEDIIVLDNNYISEKRLSFGIDTEEFNEEHIVKLAGNQSILEDVIKFFNRNRDDVQKTLSITTAESKDIKLLDTVEIGGELWTVNEIEYLRMR